MADRVVRRRGAAIISRGPRRKTIWVASADVSATTALAAGAAILDQSLTGAQVSSFGPFTIVRTVGMLLVNSDQIAAGESPFGAFGGVVVSEQARAAGVVSIPTPITEEDSDLWFVYQTFMTNVGFGDATGFANTANVFAFDSRAQRKVQDGDAVCFLLENASAAHGVDFILKFRMLLKVH